MRADSARQVVEAAIAAEEECKSVCISTPHMRMTTHMSTPGPNVLSASMRFAALTVGCPPPKLLEPIRPMVPLPRNHRHSPRTGCDSPAVHLDDAPLLLYSHNDSYGVPRSGTGVRSGWTGRSAAALPVYPSRTPRIHATARRTCAASRRAHSLTLLVESKHRESPPGRRQSQPRGVRAHGAPLEVRNRCGAGTGWIADHSTPDLRSSNLACTNEATPRGESPDGRTPRFPTATRPRPETATRPRHHRGYTAPRPKHPIATPRWQTRVHINIRWSKCVVWRG